MNIEHLCYCKRQTCQESMKYEQWWCNKEEKKLQRFCNSGKERSKCHTCQDGTGFFTIGFRRIEVDRIRHGRQTEHHHKVEPGHIYTCCWISCEETMQITICHDLHTIFNIGIFTKLEPEYRVQYVMQTQRNKQTIQCTVNESTYFVQSYDHVGKCINATLCIMPEISRQYSYCNGRDSSNNGYKSFTAKEA